MKPTNGSLVLVLKLVKGTLHYNHLTTIHGLIYYCYLVLEPGESLYTSNRNLALRGKANQRTLVLVSYLQYSVPAEAETAVLLNLPTWNWHNFELVRVHTCVQMQRLNSQTC